MKHTLKEILADEIAAHRSFGVDDGYYLATFEDGTKFEMWRCDDDPAPEAVPESDYMELPKNGWLHLDTCTCSECE